jgi:hypothetical protein
MLVIAAVLGACGAEAPSEEAQGAGPDAAPTSTKEQAPPGEEAEPGARPEVTEPHEQPAEPTADRMEGIISQSGTSEAPMLRLRPAEGRAVTLTGDLLPELTRLSGATVAVQGTRSGSGMMTRFAVTDYEVVAVGEERPVVGVLVLEGTTYRIGVGSAAVTLTYVPDGLAQNVGAKVWVTGVREGGTIRVQSFGIIRAP